MLRSGAETRIVKCPKCEVLLQEPPPDTPIYQCGGCATTLRTRAQGAEEMKEVEVVKEAGEREMDQGKYGRKGGGGDQGLGATYSYARFLPQGQGQGARAPAVLSYGEFKAQKSRQGQEMVRLPKSVREKVLPQDFQGVHASSSAAQGYEGEGGENVGMKGGHRGLRWKPKVEHWEENEDARGVVEEGGGFGEGEKIVDMYEAPVDVAEYEPSEYSSSVSEVDVNNRLIEVESIHSQQRGGGGSGNYGAGRGGSADDLRMSELGLGDQFGNNVHGVQQKQATSPLHRLVVGAPGRGRQPGGSEHGVGVVGGQVMDSSGQKEGYGADRHFQEPSVTMPSDLFRKPSVDFWSTREGQKYLATHSLRPEDVADHASPVPVPPFKQHQHAPGGLPQLSPTDSRIYTTPSQLNASLHHSESPQDRSRRLDKPPAAYYYMLHPIQPFDESDWSWYAPFKSLDGESSPLHLEVESKSYPPFPTHQDPPFVVCQNCLQLLELPLNVPPSSSSIRKVRCQSCFKVSYFSVDKPAVSPVEQEKEMTGNCTGQGAGVEAAQWTAGHREAAGELAPSVCPLPLPSPLPCDSPDSFKGKDVSEDVRGSSERFGPEHADSLGYSAGHALLQGGSDSEPDSIRNGQHFISSSLPDDRPETHDDYENHTYPSTSADGGKGRLKGSSVANIFKGLKDLTKTGQGKSYRRQVYVNGRPIPDPLVKKAEDHAGPIHPGHYWYDVHAGFWGVIGGPCQGIIPPFIEELNYPLPRDCSGAKTGVVVNGRDLHPLDLDILSRRGLPTTPGKSYRVEIDGRVTEETTDKVLKSLGRLAPSVEKRGRGHGMVVKGC